MGSHSGVVEFLAEGRLAEVFALDERRVLKLDRPEWSGVSDFEFDVLTRLAAAGLPVARAHEVVTVDGRRGVVLDRVQGTSLTSQLVECRGNAAALTELAARFSQLQATINATTVEGLPDLVTRMRSEIAMSDLGDTHISGLIELLSTLDDGQRRVCHFDFHPENVLIPENALVGPAGSPVGWVAIDWLTVANGPPLADVARTLVLCAQPGRTSSLDFVKSVHRHALRERGFDAGACDSWVRVVAGARLAEGFDGAYAEWLRGLSTGARRIVE
jgi:Ser/Thr protein kinase RdoA (MazF antagonist)